jgi:hypothetical protein
MRDMKFKPQGSPTLPEGGHERRDINFKAVIISGAVLLAIMFGTSVGLLVFDKYMNQWVAGLDDAPVSRLDSGPDRLPPFPRLQISPRADMDQMMREENERLYHYSYDDVTGIARIPIDRAIDLLVERGMPEAAAGTSEAATVQQAAGATTGTQDTTPGTIEEGAPTR